MQRLLMRLSGRVAGVMTDRRATTAIEYGLICGLIFVAIISAVRAVGNNVFSNYYNGIAAALS